MVAEDLVVVPERGKSRGAVGKFRLYRWKLYHSVSTNGSWVTTNMNTRAGTRGTRRIHDSPARRPVRAVRTFGTGGAESTTLTIDAVLSDGPEVPAGLRERPPGRALPEAQGRRGGAPASPR